jgi:chemosensory pili system protein ChpA (sensor histidine kinase/response regulator)
MARKIDPEVLIGFIEEARGYLPHILQGIEAFEAEPTQGAILEEAHRHAHSIKGTASLVGLNGLSRMAQRLEEALEELMTARRLPRAEETAALLCRIVAQIDLYLDGKANGTLREKPLIDEVERVSQELSNPPPDERVEGSGGESSSGSDALSEASDALGGRFEELRVLLSEVTRGSAVDMVSIREPMIATQLEAFRLGRSDLADALQRLVLMTEVWECLAGEGPEVASEVAAFCDRALSFLAQSVGGEESESNVAWINDESGERWGEYLALLDAGSLASPEPSDILAFQDSSAEEAASLFDPNALLRLLTGDSPGTIDPDETLLTSLTSPRSVRFRPASESPTDRPASPPAASARNDGAAWSLDESDEDEENGISSELREVFALEAEDHLRDLSTLLPALDAQPENKELLQDIRRSAHTLKGSAAMVGFRAITQLAHRMEDLLDLLYEERLAVTPEIVRLLYASTDSLEDMVTGKPAAASLDELYGSFDRLLGSSLHDETATSAGARMATVDDELLPVPIKREVAARRSERKARLAPVAAELDAEGSAVAELRRQSQFVRFPIDRLDELVKLLGELVITRTFLEQRMADLVRQVGELEHSSDRLRRVSSKLETQYEASSLSAGHPAPTGGSGNGNGNGHHLPVTTQTHGFDDLEFDRYTEFHLLTRSLSETTSDIQTVAGELGSLIGDFDSYLNRQARLSSEVEDKLMRSRMVPLATLASRLHRTVRNVASQRGKQVELVLEGENTELDKTVLEEMADPLLHLLRNSVDHGIEDSELREAIGKPARGSIRLRAGYVGSQVVIQISDDGAGLDPQILRSAAVAKGFVAAADAAKMTNEELFALVYLPGFSTAQQISEVSGRGVGLDIVKANVHKLKGSLELESQLGKGTTFTIHLPMTMAVMRAILVKSHQETFAIPLSAVKQIVRLDREEMELVGQEPVLRVGGLLYPVYSLGKVLNLNQPADESVSRRPVLILEVGTKQVAIIVDHLLGGREIVIKNLGNHLRRVRNVMGATLMGDGSVVLILDPVEIVREAVESKMPSRPALPTPVAVPRDTWSILIVDDSPSVRRVLTNLVKNAGWKPITAKDGLEALEILHHTANVPDLILLDVEMPRMDGYELLATLKASEAYRAIPVVMVTSRAGDKHRRKALDLGGSGYVVKPYQDEALLNVVRHLVRESRTRQVVHS